MSKTAELEESAKWIFTDIASGSAKAVDELLADLARAYPDERRLEFVRRSVGDILREYDAAYRAEIEAKRAAPTWQTKEGVEERENLRRQVAVLSTQLDSIIEQQKEQQEREREVAWIEERWEALKRSAKIANRTFWLTLALFLVALVIGRFADIKQENNTAQAQVKISDEQLGLTMQSASDRWRITAVQDDKLAKQISEDVIRNLPAKGSELQEELRKRLEKFQKKP